MLIQRLGDPPGGRARVENGRGIDTKKKTLKTERKKNQQEDKARNRQSVKWDNAPWTQK